MSIENRFSARPRVWHFSHLYALSPSRYSARVKLRNACSSEFPRLISNERSKMGSSVLLGCWQVRHVTCDRNCPPKIRETHVVIWIARTGFGLSPFKHASCKESRRHRRNSWASSCRPNRKDLLICFRDRARPAGRITLPLAERAERTCSWVATMGQKPPWGDEERRSRVRRYSARGAQWVRHWSTLFIKHVLPRLA